MSHTVPSCRSDAWWRKYVLTFRAALETQERAMYRTVSRKFLSACTDKTQKILFYIYVNH